MTNMLLWWQWLILAAIPPLIVLLYFLKLKRQPLEVPSTYLWQRTIEDLHVNSLWQRLRQNILLLLQLLLILLVMLACLRPSWRDRQLSGNRFIFLVDVSASMSATDTETSRLEEAKRRIEQLIDNDMNSGDSAMVISFSDEARIEHEFSRNRRRLARAVTAIEPTHRTTDLDEALRAAAGRANPADSRERESNVMAVADALPATLYIFSDGNVPAVSEFDLGNLTPFYVRMGTETCHNVGIVAFNAERHPEDPDRLHVFGRLEHFARENTTDTASPDISVKVNIYLNDRLIDAQNVNLAHGGTGGLDVTLNRIDSGILRLEIESEDDLAVDNVAYATVTPPRRAKVLLVTPGNKPFELAIATTQAEKLAEVTIQGPEYLAQSQYSKQAADAAFDLVIYDQCAPKSMPQSNTLFIGQLPPVETWRAGELQGPQIIDMDRAHPLMQFIEMGNVDIAEARPLLPPPGSVVLIDSNLVQEETEHSAIFAIAPRDSFEDAVLGFTIVDNAANTANTNWPIRVSFPIFINNTLRYLGGAVGRFQLKPSVQPGEPIAIRSENPVPQIAVQTPSGQNVSVSRGSLGHFTFVKTGELGVYTVSENAAQEASQRFAVNLFDSRESNILPQGELDFDHESVAAQTHWEPTRREAWKYLLLLALAVVLVEWYIFNRRVYF